MTNFEKYINDVSKRKDYWTKAWMNYNERSSQYRLDYIIAEQESAYSEMDGIIRTLDEFGYHLDYDFDEQALFVMKKGEYR